MSTNTVAYTGALVGVGSDPAGPDHRSSVTRDPMQPSGDSRVDVSAAVDPPTLSQTTVRCPGCGSIDWFRNCNTLVESESTGEVVYRCVLASDPRLVTSPWACMSCAYEVPEPGPLHDQLSALAVAG